MQMEHQLHSKLKKAHKEVRYDGSSSEEKDSDCERKALMKNLKNQQGELTTLFMGLRTTDE